MDNTNNNISESITKSLIGQSNNMDISQTLNNGTETSFLENISNVSISTWIIIILILALLGFNIFIYFAKGTQDIANFIKKILSFFGIVTGQAIDVSAEGAKAVVGATKGAVNITADTINTGLTELQKNIPDAKQERGLIKGASLDHLNNEKDLHISQTGGLNNILEQNKPQNIGYEADDSSSNIQGNIPKSGWCYIGSDRNFRSCAYVGIDDKCISGEIFPSHELCINPTLRA